MEGSREVDPSAVKICTVRRAPTPLGSPNARWEEPMWAAAHVVNVDNFEWPNPDGPENKCRDNVVHRPKVQARTMWDDQYLAVQFRVEDKYVRCKGTEFQDMVCRDSCCEFFVAPFAQSDDDTAFFNFEVNAAATMLLYKCRGGGCRDTTKVTLEDAASIMMASSLAGKKTAADAGVRVPADGWEEDCKLPASDPRLVAPEIQVDTAFCIEYHVPWELFTKWHGVQRPTGGVQWRCNFCKSFREPTVLGRWCLHLTPLMGRRQVC